MATEHFIAAGTSKTLQGRFMGLTWSGGTTAGDTCKIIDLYTGKLIFCGRASGTNSFQGIMLPIPLAVRSGLQITQISSGEVILYFEDR